MERKNYTHETPLMMDILKEFGRYPALRLERNNVGEAYGVGGVRKLITIIEEALRKPASAMALLREALKFSRQIRPVTFGVPGDPDIRGIIGIAPKRGVVLVIECKTEHGKTDKARRVRQQNRRDMYEGMGAVYCRATQVEDVYTALAAASITREMLAAPAAAESDAGAACG